MVDERIIIDSIKHAQKVVNTDLRKNVVWAVYNTLKSFYQEDKKYVLLNAPTGSGKSMIGLITAMCVDYITSHVDGISEYGGTSYYLTSTKSLQEQMDNDIDRFRIGDFANVLKGTNSYDCTYGNQMMSVNGTVNDFERQTYKDAWCQGIEKQDRWMTQFAKCEITCPYECQRLLASRSTCAVLNYHYFLTFNRSSYNPYFTQRELTICDEAHMLPSIVEDFYSMDFNINLWQRIRNFCSFYNIGNNGSDDKLMEVVTMIPNIEEWFKKPISYDTFKMFVDEYGDFLSSCLSFVKSKINKQNPDVTINKLIISIKSAIDTVTNISNIISSDIKNIFIESKTDDKSIYYKHTIKNLNETELIRENFLKKNNKLLLMSATLGNLSEFATIMGVEPEKTAKFSIKSSWSFDNSPIYLTDSAYLNYSNFEKNIDKVLDDCLTICNFYHPKDKGIIHTATFGINDKLKNLIDSLPDDKYSHFKSRFLFYTDAQSKEKCIDTLKNNNFPYIIVGPSLCEGIDLNDDNGRFNILIKVPYPQINAMTKRKMDVSPLWYKRTTIEKILQSIGRTNRNANDYSTVYLLDKCFDKLVYEMDEYITKRLDYIRL